MLNATNGTLRAYAKAKDVEVLVPGELLARLKDNKLKRPVTATVIVEEVGGDRRIVEVRSEPA
jgi:hypothetical protein